MTLPQSGQCFRSGGIGGFGIVPRRYGSWNDSRTRNEPAGHTVVPGALFNPLSGAYTTRSGPALWSLGWAASYSPFDSCNVWNLAKRAASCSRVSIA